MVIVDAYSGLVLAHLALIDGTPAVGDVLEVPGRSTWQRVMVLEHRLADDGCSLQSSVGVQETGLAIEPPRKPDPINKRARTRPKP